MEPVVLYDYQMDAVERMKDGCILCGGVGSGKSRTGLAYYYTYYGGKLNTEVYVPMKDPAPLYIITTARKRDTKEWEKELEPFDIHNAVIDSWNNIKKYKDVENAFFIFDEQRVVGSGTWVKAFLRISKCNRWILLSATPGDSWSDYIPVFIANGYFKNRTEFIRKHVIYSSFTSFPKIEKYMSTGRLAKMRDDILVTMKFDRATVSHHEQIYVDYDPAAYKLLLRSRWNPWTQEPIVNATELCYCLRKVCNTDESRKQAVIDITDEHEKCIIFYNFDYELDILKSLPYGTYDEYCAVAEWNGHRHEPIPDTKRWVYLVQYTAGSEGWNCTETDTVIFFSMNYSYKTMIQASGRIDRVNTPFRDLYFYHIKSHSPIDMAIEHALRNKKNFNESAFLQNYRVFNEGK